jgi:hypothetical protein
MKNSPFKIHYSLFTLLLCALASSQTTQPATQPSGQGIAIVKATDPHFLRIGNSLVIQGLNLKCSPPGSQFYGLYINVPNLTNLVIQDCRFEGFVQNVAVLGAKGFHFDHNVSINAAAGFAPSPPHNFDRAQLLYVQGVDDWHITNNFLAGMPAWPTYNPLSLADKTLASQCHAIYGNAAGSTSNGECVNNICLDALGSQIAIQFGGNISGNVVRSTFDWAIIAQGDRATVNGNALFGPKIDAPPNFGGGIRWLALRGTCDGNWFSGS